MGVELDLIYVHLPLVDPLSAFRLLKETPFGIELNFETRWLNCPKEWIDEIKRGSKDLRSSLAIHGPCLDLNAGSLDERIREITKERFFQAMELCGILGSDTLILHHGYYPPAYNVHYKVWMKNNIKTWASIAEAAEGIGVEIRIENYAEDSPEPILILMEALDPKSVRVCLDIGHANAFSKMNPTFWIDNLSNWISEVHLHDNDGSSDQHLPIGRGTIDYRAVLHELKKHGLRPRLTLEPSNVDEAYSNANELEAMGWMDLRK